MIKLPAMGRPRIFLALAVYLYGWVIKSVGGSDTCKGGHSLTIGVALNTASEFCCQCARPSSAVFVE